MNSVLEQKEKICTQLSDQNVKYAENNNELEDKISDFEQSISK